MMTTIRTIRNCNRNIERTYNNVHSVYVVRGNNVYTNAAVWEDGGHPSVTDDEWAEMLKGSQMPRPVKGAGLAKGSCPIQFQRLTACPCGPNVSLPHYAFACIPRYRGLRLHRRAIDRARLFILPVEADKLPVS